MSLQDIWSTSRVCKGAVDKEESQPYTGGRLALRSPNKDIRLSADVMHIDGHMFLISVAAPL